VVAARVAEGRARALARQGVPNAQLSPAQLDALQPPEPAAKALLLRASQQLAWSARAYHRVLRLARSVADLAQNDVMDVSAVAEAIQLRRGLDNRA
jgi:magnesium chelatase family protein